MMKIHYFQGYSEDVLYSYRFIVFRTVCESAKALVNAMRQFEVTPESDKIWELADFIAAYVLDPDPISSGSTFRTLQNSKANERHSFFNKIAEIASPNYLPTDMDVLQTRAKTNGILETRFEMDQLSLCVANVGGDRSDRKKWMHCFENVSLEENPQNAIMESLLLFDSIVNSQWFMRTSVILFLNNVRKFEQKLAKNPLENYFRDYSGGNDVDKAAKYLIWRFNQVNRAHLTLYPHLVGPDNASLMRLVSSAVKQTILNNALRDDFKF
ncbi:guanine nucleotide-binding protein alpha-3 subunit [Dactylonectria macrodidyma]|uniref:Guanine nucleotide-binding protein alpha-3 subunit n=1 Tax=Dactylonectria macrodidyma TaxID=307937 RepID=A0A9P9IMD9_9HYPO|nr:guanine nucleotide-binding protein alpha-3 subunit [Dactylonectria macrodidyma]